MGITTSFVNMQDPDAVRKAIRPNTRAILIETPSNPLLNIVDIAAITAIAREHGLLSIADNTFMSPYFQHPFDFGVDIIVHSNHKYSTATATSWAGPSSSAMTSLPADRLPRQCPGHRLLAVRRLAGASRRQDAELPHGGPPAQRDGRRPLPRRPFPT